MSGEEYRCPPGDQISDMQTLNAQKAASGAGPSPQDVQDPLKGQAYPDRYKQAHESVDPFKAGKKYTAEYFLPKCQVAFETYDILPQHQVQLAKSRLSGAATSFLVGIREGKMTFGDFSESLLANFPSQAEEAAHFQLLRLGCQKGKLIEFISAYNKQLGRAKMVHATAEKLYDDLVNEIYLTALGQPMRQAVEQARPESGWSSLKQLQDRSVEVNQSLGRSGKQTVGEKPVATGQGRHKPYNCPRYKLAWPPRGGGPRAPAGPPPCAPHRPHRSRHAWACGTAR